MFRVIAMLGICFSFALALTQAHANVILDFNDVPPGTLLVFNPYVSQGFELTSTGGGFIFNSPDTGNGAPQTIGNNPFYAGANGFASFAPATVGLQRSDAQPFSLLSIDLARNFAFDPAATVTFTGALAGGGTIAQTFSISIPAGLPASFQTFDFTGFTDLASVSWSQALSGEPPHQFGNIQIASAAATPVPEPSSLALLSGAFALIAARKSLRRKKRSHA